MDLNFTKMNGAGNDFVVLDNREGAIALDRVTIALLCDRHRGIGADGLLMVESAGPESGADFTFRYFNADGGEAEMCGNGARCFARFASKFLPEGRDTMVFDSIAGPISAKLDGAQVCIGLSTPYDHVPGRDLPVNDRLLNVHSINTGVPHAVVFVEDLEAVDVVGDGAALRHHAAFRPAGTNANFVHVDGPDIISVRTYERGVEGETLACGTGVTACALIHHLVHGAAPPVRVRVRGGDVMSVAFDVAPDGSFSNVSLTGPADVTFSGRVRI